MKRKSKSVLVFCALLLLILMGSYVSAADAVKSLAVNTSVSGAPASRQADTYQVKVPSRGKLSIQLNHENLFSTDTYWTVELLAADLSTVLQSYNSTGVDESLSSATLGVTQGTYYVRVYARKECSHEYSDKPYTLRVNFTPSTTWEVEYDAATKNNNNAQGSATAMSANKTYYGTLYNSNDIDFFKVKVPKSGSLTLTFQHPNVFDKQNYWKIQLVNSKTEVFYEIDSPGTKVSLTSAQIGVSSGTYYVKIINGGYNKWNSSEYSLKLKYKSASNWEKEYTDKTRVSNNTMATANSITAGKAVKGTISTKNDVDYFKVKVKSTKTVTINFSHAKLSKKSKMWKITVYNSKTKQMYSFSSRGLDKSLTKKVKLPKGTYYVKISGSTGWDKTPYTLKVK